MKLLTIIKSLRYKEFAKLYSAQTISLLGDAFTWVGIALLSFEFAGTGSSRILSTALTLRVVAFILIAPYAGVLADKFNRKNILLIADFGRMVLILLLAFVTAEWQIYVLIFLLNALSAFFTPSFKASIPQMIREKKDFAPAITLSNITYQLLAIMGPGIAGIAAAWIGSRNIFLLDSLSFLLSALFVLAISRRLFSISPDSVKPLVAPTRMSELLMGTRLLFKDSAIRFALFTEFAAAIVGANILVNTIMYVKTKLSLDDKHYGLVMSALGVGAIVGAFASATLDKTNSRKPSLILGGVIISASVFFADQSSFIILMLIWLFAGLGQNLAEMPSQMLIAERIPLNQQGRVYGAHFAWSHLWWAIAYPIAGYLGTHYPNSVFLIAGSLGVLIMITSIILNSLKKPRL